MLFIVGKAGMHIHHLQHHLHV